MKMSTMDKGDRIAMIVGLGVLGVLVLGVLLNLVAMWVIADGERTVLGRAHSSPNVVSSPVASPSVTPVPTRPDRLR